MAANLELQRLSKGGMLRGLDNLLRKENRLWLGTRRWWINALIWPVLLCGLTANMLFVPTVVNLASAEDIARAGGITGYVILMGLSVFFEFGVQAIGIGAIILCQDLIVDERQSGVAQWLLTKPVSRRTYLLAKLLSNAAYVMLFLVGLPAALTYGLLSLRMGTAFPTLPFLAALGITCLHTLFYLSLTLMLGTIFNTRPPILGVALGFLLGGNLLAGLFKPLLYVTPWMLAKVASLAAGEQPIPTGLLWPPLIATAVLSLVFIFAALVKFDKTEF